MGLQTVILAGGFGTRLKEMSDYIPKPMVPVGGKPLICRIMDHYVKYGHRDFVLALGYKQEEFKKYFILYNGINNDISIDGMVSVLSHKADTISKYRMILSDTGLNTLKGARLKRVEKYVHGDTFMMTYGDAISDVDISALLEFHQKHGKMVTLTGVHPKPRFGELIHEDGCVTSYKEKPESAALVNGGFMVLNRKVFDYLDDNCDFEKGPLEKIASEGQLMVYPHKGWWACCDTLYDMIQLQEQWEERNARNL